MKFKTLEVSGIMPALHGMRNPMNSHHLQDSHITIGENDMGLAKKLIKAGTEHRKFLRQIQVWVDIEAPRYWWSEFDTYKIGTSANSTSTMHKLFNKQSEVTLDMFEVHSNREIEIVESIIAILNSLRTEYFQATTQEQKNEILATAKRILPESYKNTRTVNLNYEVIRNMRNQRKNHRLKHEWQDSFLGWIDTLPYAEDFLIE